MSKNKSKAQKRRQTNDKRNHYRNSILEGKPSKVFKSLWNNWVVVYEREVIGTRYTEKDAEILLAERILSEQLNRLLD